MLSTTKKTFENALPSRRLAYKHAAINLLKWQLVTRGLTKEFLQCWREDPQTQFFYQYQLAIHLITGLPMDDCDVLAALSIENYMKTSVKWGNSYD